MAKIYLQCMTCGKVFPSGISMISGASVTFRGNKSRCPYCKSWESIPDGIFKATAEGFIQILKESKNPLQDAKDMLEGLGRARDTQDLSKVPYGSRIEGFLQQNKLMIFIAIAMLEILVDLLGKQPDIEINNTIINQEFYNQYNQTINIRIDGD
ncbi:MAG: hypothetical protein AAB524_02520 [Patescibacteria group bacterium]